MGMTQHLWWKAAGCWQQRNGIGGLGVQVWSGVNVLMVHSLAFDSEVVLVHFL